MTEFQIKAWDVQVTGYWPPVRVYAKSRGKALSNVWSRLLVAEPECTFSQFLTKVSLKSAETLPEGFGKPITVQGEPGFLIDRSEKAVHFVRPGSDTVLYSHPHDVTAAA